MLIILYDIYIANYITYLESGHVACDKHTTCLPMPFLLPPPFLPLCLYNVTLSRLPPFTYLSFTQQILLCSVSVWFFSAGLGSGFSVSYNMLRYIIVPRYLTPLNFAFDS